MKANKKLKAKQSTPKIIITQPNSRKIEKN